MKRVLVCTIGATPAVVTETVWALQAERAWRPDEIHLITTTHSLNRVRTHLQTPGADNALAAFCGARVTIYVPRFSSGPAVFPPEAPAGQACGGDALGDIDDDKSAAVMCAAIWGLVTDITSDAETELHLSLAGGRKTMSAHALLAFALRGRVNDHASHVLVSPSAFENNRHFWRPDQGGKIPSDGGGELDPKDARVQLVFTPIPLLRYIDGMEDALERSMQDAIEGLNLAARLETQPSIVLDTKTNTIDVCGRSVPLSPRIFAHFRLLATARAERWCVSRYAENNAARIGWLTYEAVAANASPSGAMIRELFADFVDQAERVKYGALGPDEVGNYGADEFADRRSSKGKRPSQQSWREDVLKAGLTREQRIAGVKRLLPSDKVDFKNELGEALGIAAYHLLGPHYIRAQCYGLAPPPEAFRIV